MKVVWIGSLAAASLGFDSGERQAVFIGIPALINHDYNFTESLIRILKIIAYQQINLVLFYHFLVNLLIC